MRSLGILPRRGDDDTAGNLRLKLYYAKLGGFSKEALSYLTSTALDRCQWFPTISECLAILVAWPNAERDSQRREKAKLLIRGEMQSRMDETLARLSRRELSQAEIDALSDFWKRAAAERCFLWAWPDGRFTVRADITKLSPEDADAERASVKAMFAEWEAIKLNATEEGA